MRKFVPFLSACLLGACVSGPAWPDGASKVDRKAMADVDGEAALTAELASKIWNWAEVGYQEEKSSALLQETLKEKGVAAA